MNESILIDGSRHNGGGSLLRCALILSSVTKIPFEMINCISNREEKGLDNSHIKTIDLFAQATKAQVKGSGNGSQTIAFYPKQIFNQKKIFVEFFEDPVSLPLQSLMVAALFAKEKTTFVALGGTHLKNAPSLTSLRETFLRLIHRYTSTATIEIENLSFCTDDEGTATVVIEPRDSEDSRPALIVEPRELVAIKGEFFASKSMADLELLESFAHISKVGLKSYEVPVTINTRYAESCIDCVNLHLFAYYGDEHGFDNDNAVVISADKRIEDNFIEQKLFDLLDSFKNRLLNKALNPHTVEALIPLLALLGGTIESENISDRILGSVYVAEKILDVKFEIDSNIISCRGYFEENKDSALDIEDI